MCLRDHLLFIPDHCCSPFLRLQLLRKERSFLHVIRVTNNGRAWEGAGWETLPIRPNAIHLTDSRDGGAAGEWQQEHHHHRCRPRGAGRCAPLYMGRRWQRVLISLALLGLLWASTHNALLPWAVEAHFQIHQTFTENILCAHPKK